MLPRIPDKLYLSLGENCLSDIILNRHGLKSFTTIYSHGRSNIDNAIHLEQERHENLLNNACLYYDYVGKKKVVRNRCYAVSSEVFSELHRNGFEFTHHDVLSNVSARNNLYQKVHKLNYYRGKSNTVFFYHYRACENSSLELIFEKVTQFARFYEVNGKTCEVIVLTQELIDQKEKKRLINIKYSDYIQAFIFKSHHIWEGDNHKHFRALVDDDLIKLMMEELKIGKSKIET